MPSFISHDLLVKKIKSGRALHCMQTFHNGAKTFLKSHTFMDYDFIANFFIITTSKTIIQTDLTHDLIFIVFDAFIMHYIFSGLMQRFSTTNNFNCRGPKVNSTSKIFWLHCASLDRYGICHSLCSRAIWLVGMWPEVPSHVPYRQEFWLETTKPRWGPNHFWVAHYKNLGHSFAKIQI